MADPNPPESTVGSRRRQRPCLALAVLWGVFGPWGPLAHAGEDELYLAAKRLQADHAAEIEQLAAWCEERGLAEQANKTRGLSGKRDPYKLYLPVLPEEAGGAKLPEGASPELVEWHQRFGRLRREQAGALYELARRAVRGRRASLAFELVLAAIHADPDHLAARRLLGYQEYRGQWHTVYEVRKLRAGQVRHEQFGWLPKSHVRRYEQGQRRYRGRWISAEEDAELHRDIESGWVVDSEHYSIVTNHGLPAGVELGEKLERLFGIWRQIFIRYYASESHLIALFNGSARSSPTQTPRFHVVYFRDRDDYNRSLRVAMPNIGISIGLYLDRMRRAYFFAGKECDDRTLYHEATHQLFHQSRRVAPAVGRSANFWVVEGIAMYMESLRREGDYYVLGGLDDQRMHAARYRLLHDGFYVPLEEFTAYGMEKLQTDQRIATLYSQAAGLANFLVYYDGGRYRDALVAYLSAVYAGRDTPNTLAEVTGTRYSQLDKQYRQFMEESLRKAGADARRNRRNRLKPVLQRSGHSLGPMLVDKGLLTD